MAHIHFYGQFDSDSRYMFDSDDFDLDQAPPIQMQMEYRGALESGRFSEVVISCNECEWGAVCLVSNDYLTRLICLECETEDVTSSVLRFD